MPKKSQPPKDTLYFHYYNANSHGHITTDCVIRAISTVMEQPWEVTYDDLVDLGRKYGRLPNDRVIMNKYLVKNGFVKMKEPRNLDNRKYRVCEYIKDINNSLTAIASLGNQHVAAIVDGVVYDTWDSSNEVLHTYYVKKEE